MKRLILPLAAALVAMLTIAAVAGGHDAPSKRSLDLVGTEVSFNFVDVDPKQADENTPPSPGDSFLLSESITKHGKSFGNLYVQCTFVTVEALQCVATFDLQTGQITVQGALIGDATDFTFAVTGGTGEFSGAGGTVRIQDDDEEGSPAMYTLQLR